MVQVSVKNTIKMSSVKKIQRKILKTVYEPNEYQDKDEDDEKAGVYDSLRPILTVTMLLGIMPICNVRSARGRNVQFKWCCPQSFYSLIVLISLLLGVYLMISSYVFLFGSLMEINDVVLSLTGPVFYIANTITLMQLVNVCRQLPALLRYWDEVATKLMKYLPPASASGRKRRTLSDVFASRRKVITIAAVMAISSVIDHTLHDVNLPILLCRNNYTNFFQCYLTRGNPQFNNDFGNGVPFAFCFWVIQKYANVAWHFHDIFIVIITLPLRANLKVIVDYIKRNHANLDHRWWRALREDHLDFIEFTERLDKVISKMILQSYAVNLFYLCFQGSLAVRPMERATIQLVYYVYSLVHLIARTCAVTAAAASIHEQATGPLPYLLECPAPNYSTEVYRFTNQLITIKIGLTGYRFFMVTRKTFLTVLSVLITYELILLKVA